MNVIIETPKGSIEKFKFNPEIGSFELGKSLPVGLAFPFDFGYLPGTIGEDGDPLDVIVVSEFKFFPGCIVDCRIIGCMQAKQGEFGKLKKRNDRFLAVPEVSKLYSGLTTISHISTKERKELEHFFENYNKEEGKSFMVLKWTPAKAATATALYALSKTAKAEHLIQLFIPLYSKQGKLYSESVFTSIKSELTEKFGGVTMYNQSTVSGLWKDDNSDCQRDTLIVLEVMVDSIESKYWNGYKRRLQRLLKQDEILIRRMPVGLL